MSEKLKPFLCKCRQGAGAMTVKVVNDDFFQCPRCSGLFVRNTRPEVSVEEIEEVIKNTLIDYTDAKSIDAQLNSIINQKLQLSWLDQKQMNITATEINLKTDQAKRKCKEVARVLAQAIKERINKD